MAILSKTRRSKLTKLALCRLAANKAESSRVEPPPKSFSSKFKPARRHSKQQSSSRVRMSEEANGESSSSSTASPPGPPARSLSLISDSSILTGCQYNEFDSSMEAFLENARFGNYEYVSEVLARYNSSRADELKMNFDINYRGFCLNFLK